MGSDLKRADSRPRGEPGTPQLPGEPDECPPLGWAISPTGAIERFPWSLRSHPQVTAFLSAAPGEGANG